MKFIVGKTKLTLDDFYNVVVNKHTVVIGDKTKEKISKSRETVDKLLKEGKVAYGITTGFGSLKDKVIPSEDLEKLQYNLIISHAVGVGAPAPPEIVRGMFLLRLMCIANGNSGVRLCVAEKLVEALNKNFIPYVPELGTVGASGDLAPLSHLILGLLGKGKAYDHKTKEYIDAASVLKSLDMESLTLAAKEGLALNNGTQFITSYTAMALYHATRIMKLSNIIAACTMEALHATLNALDPRIHKSRPHKGQIKVAKEILGYLAPDGKKSESCTTHTKTKIQEAYSLRCIPQVHGPIYDLIKFVGKIIETEMNCTNDNPLIFDGDIISGGNFHAQYPAMAADQLAYGMSILCNISERRLERLVNSSLNKFMPSFLIDDPGLNSGLMIIQYAAAGITAENRHLAAPGSIHTIPTCEGAEDVVSMGGWSARKAFKSVENTYHVLTFELFAAVQALEFTKEKFAEKISALKDYVRKDLEIPRITVDTYMKEYVDKLHHWLHHSEKIFEIFGK